MAVTIKVLRKGATRRVIICSASDSESDTIQISTTNNRAWHTFLNVMEQCQALLLVVLIWQAIWHRTAGGILTAVSPSRMTTTSVVLLGQNTESCSVCLILGQSGCLLVWVCIYLCSECDIKTILVVQQPQIPSSQVVRRGHMLTHSTIHCIREV
jgi:hypothetical protein